MLRMIIVEDEDLIREWLSRALDYQQLGIDLVATARDGEEGLECIRQCHPDIVLTDLMMPRKTGFEMFDNSQDIPYEKMILSSYSDFQHAKKAMTYGVKHFLEKPLDIEELRDTLWQIVLDQKNQVSDSQNSHYYQDLPMISLPSVQEDFWSAHLVAYLHQHYNHSISTEEIARHFGYSESYLYKKIKEDLGITLKDYLNRYRIKRAIQLMTSQPDLRVYEVAEAVGFSDYNYFGKVFRRYTGLTYTTFKENFTHKG